MANGNGIKIKPSYLIAIITLILMIAGFGGTMALVKRDVNDTKERTEINTNYRIANEKRIDSIEKKTDDTYKLVVKLCIKMGIEL